ncbi:MAG: Phosphoglucosamine mutase [Deinococcota bacterium]|jgi:phosphoglucosamine mutase
MSRKYFGTDGVRAVAGEAPLTAAWTLALGRAAAEVFKGQSRKPSVVIGKDTRQSGDMLEAALAAGLTAQGVNVIHLGVMPTPGVSYLARQLGATAGVVISASHNPYQDNGIKFFGASGEKLTDALEQEIESNLERDLPAVTGANLGAVTDYREAERLYSSFLMEHAPNLSGLKIALDCANGATHRLAPKIFQRAGADVFALYTNPDGRNINMGCGSTHPQTLQKVVTDMNFDLGIAFDGDGDRCLMVDNTGTLIDGDHVLYINGVTRGERTVVATLMSNMGLEVKLREQGIHLERTGVGDRYVHERLLEKGLTLGGEQSGHTLFLDAAPTGDGMLSALLTLKAVRSSGKTLAQWREEMPLYPQILVNVRVTDKSIAHHQEVQAALQVATAKLEGRGRINLRPSGTENLLRVMVEGQSDSEITELAESVASVIRRLA